MKPSRFWGADLMVVPVVNARGESKLITPKQYRLIARVMAGTRFNQRRLAGELGYSLAGLNDALESLVTIGILIKRTTRGRLGSTFAKMRPGCHVGNVREQGSTSLNQRSDVRDQWANISDGLAQIASFLGGDVGHDRATGTAG